MDSLSVYATVVVLLYTGIEASWKEEVIREGELVGHVRHPRGVKKSLVATSGLHLSVLRHRGSPGCVVEVGAQRIGQVSSWAACAGEAEAEPRYLESLRVYPTVSKFSILLPFL